MATRPSVRALPVKRHGNQNLTESDLVVVEEPLEIRLEYGAADDRRQRSIAVTMRTPGHDRELAVGFLIGEGIIGNITDILKVDWCGSVQRPEEFGNVVKVELQPSSTPKLDTLERNFYMSSSCGVCGKASLDAVSATGCPVLPDTGHRYLEAWLLGLPAIAQEVQTIFRHTGGIHATSIFDARGNMLVQKEDVGRHNALDKAIGHLHLVGNLSSAAAALVSGRVGFELVQKTVMAGIPLLAAVGAPTSLAVELAQQHGLTLVGFLREGRFNIYSAEWRVNG